MTDKSLLFPLAPLGYGTGDIEALPSYLCRLAIIHSVSVIDLYNYLLSYGQQFNILKSTFKRKKNIGLTALVSGNKQVFLMIKAIEALTGYSLQGTNFTMLSKYFSIPSRDISKSFKWCPKCINEMVDEGIDPHIKLIWLLKTTTRCNKHLTLLEDKCPYCNKPQYLSSNRISFAFCYYCKSRLANANSSSEIGASWYNYGNDVSEFLIEYVANYQVINRVDLNKSFIPLVGVSKSLCFLANKREESPTHRLRIGMSAIQSYCCALGYEQSGKPSLLMMRRISHSFGISLYTLFSGNACNSTAYLSKDLFCRVLPEYLRACNRKKPNDHERVRNDLIRLLKKMSVPLQLKSVAESLGVSKGYLEYRFPDLCKKINQERINYKKELRSNMLNTAKLSALSFFTSEKYEGYPQSRKQAYKVLRRETNLPKFVLNRAIEEAFQTVFT